MGIKANVPPSILKKRKNDTELLNTSKKFKGSNSFEMEDFLKRVGETGLQSTYVTVVEEIAVASAEKQEAWLSQLTDNVALLDVRGVDFVSLCLEVPWKLDESLPLRNTFKKFLNFLAMSPNDFCNMVIEHLLKYFIPVVEDNAMLTVTPNDYSQARKDLCNLAIETICFIHSKIPLCEKIILHKLTDAKPYTKAHPHTFIIYVKALLILGGKIENLKQQLLELAVSVILELDLATSRNDLMADEDEDDDNVFSMDLDDSSQPASKNLQAATVKRLEWIQSNPIAHNVDSLMNMVITYLHCVTHDVPFTFHPVDDMTNLQNLGCVPGLVNHKRKTDGCCQCEGSKQNVNAVRDIYGLLCEVFSKIILPTPLSPHVQFLLYYLIGLRVSLATSFIEHLRSKYFVNPSCSREVRKNAMCYIGSLLVRCPFIPFTLVHATLEIISRWCTTYIAEQIEGNNYFAHASLHPVFYTACQTIFYVFTFRFRDYSKNKSSMSMVNSLNFQTLTTSNLNPLGVCSANIVTSFAAITNHFQFTFCYSIIERNKRFKLAISKEFGENQAPGAYIPDSQLNCFFPFDPYLLVGSRHLIVNNYQEFEGLPEDVKADAPAVHSSGDVPKESIEEDEFLEMSYNSTHMNSFTEYQLNTPQ